MVFQENPNEIRWRLHLSSPPRVVHRMLASEDGRTRFWAESAQEREGAIEFRFIDGTSLRGKIIENHPPHRFAVEYFGGSVVTFALGEDGKGGTDLTLTETNVNPTWRVEEIAGWVSVLLALKAAVDHGVDLRNTIPAARGIRGMPRTRISERHGYPTETKGSCVTTPRSCHPSLWIVTRVPRVS